MTTFRTYTTLEGQRWDHIAFAEYRDPFGYERIIRANLAYRSLKVLPGGVRLRIPVVTELKPTPRPEQLPPWRR